MTPRLEEAFRAVEALSEADQDALAAIVLAEIRDRELQARVFARSEAIFAELAEWRAGRERPRGDR